VFKTVILFCYENKTFSPSPDGSENPLVTGFGIKIATYSGTTRVIHKNVLLLEKHTHDFYGHASAITLKKFLF
jgi:hypothetical protein